MFSNLWNQKYIPKTTKELIGNVEAIEEIKNWLINYNNNKHKSLFIYGPHNSGKTLITNIIIKELNYEIIEYNSFNFIKSNFIEKIKELSRYTNISYKKFIIVIDEIDALMQIYKSIISEIYKYIKNTDNKYTIKIPIICISSKKYGCNSIKNLVNLSYNIVLEKPCEKHLHILLNKICNNENIMLDSESKELIINYSKNNYKMVILILESIKYYYKDLVNIKKKHIQKTINVFGNPNIDMSISQTINEIFNNKISCKDINNYYEVDKSYIPIYIHANYINNLHHNSTDNINTKLDKIEYYYDLLIDSNIIEDKNKYNCDLGMEDYVGILSCLPANYTLNNNSNNKNSYNSIKSSCIFSKLNYKFYNLKLINIIVKKLNISCYNFQEYTFKIYKYFILKEPDIKEYSYFLQYLKKSEITYQDFDKSIKLSYLYELYKKNYTNKIKKNIEKLFNNFIV